MFLLIFFVLGAGAALIIAYLLALVFMVVYTLVSYLFESMFLSQVYHRKKDKHAWISYIPFVNKYFYGNMKKEERELNKQWRKNKETV